MFNQATLWATDIATSSQASADGPMPCDSLVGPTISPSGPDRPLANLSARQAKALGLLTSGTSGPASSGSSASASLATSVANRLRQAMRFDGGILWRLTWKGRATPARRWIYQRQASARRTSGADCSGWPTPNAIEENKTPAEHFAREERKQAVNPNLGGLQLKLSTAVQMVSAWPTPNTLDTIDREGLRPSRIATNRDSGYLTEIVVRVPWPTPVTTDAVGAGGRNETAQKDGSKTHAGTSLTDAAMAADCWHTPVVRDLRNSGGDGTNPRDLPRQAALTHGPTLSGSHAQTGKRGQLNPAFSLWLMGYPTAWGRCAARVMPSSRKRQQKSSAPGRR